jgi:hypothetical protein
MPNINVLGSSECLNDFERIERISFIDTTLDDMFRILDSCINRTHLSDDLNVQLDAASERRAALKELMKQTEQDELDRLYNL